MRKKEKTLKKKELLTEEESLVITDLVRNLEDTDITGMLKSVNYTVLEDGVYFGQLNLGESTIIITSGKKDPFIFDFGWTPGFKSVSKMTFKIIVKNRRGYLNSKGFTRIYDYLTYSVESKIREIKILENEKKLRYGEDELLENLKNDLILQKQVISYLSNKKDKLIEEVAKTRERIYNEGRKLNQEIEELKLESESPELSDRELKCLKKAIAKKRKLSILTNYKLIRYKHTLNILSGIDSDED